MTDFSAVKPGFVRRRSAIYNARRAERLATGRPNRSDIAQMLAAYEHRTERPPITLPRLSIQDAE